MKVTIIGAGSIGFTRRLVRDILSVPEFAGVEFALHDINARNLEMIAQLARRDIEHNGLPARLVTSLDRREALRGARYVINTTRIGGLEAFQTDIDIPLKYGVDQCVGDTLAAGGIMYGQRNIPQILAFCQDIREQAGRDALFLNYANPMAMNTWAGIRYGGVRMVGLCHGVQGGHAQIAQVIELLVNDGRANDTPGFRAVTPKEVDIVCAGINHQTWYVQVQYDGQDWTGRLLEGFARHPVFSQTEKVRIDVLRRFGYYSTESNGHLSEYVPWYRKRAEEIPTWIDLRSWINGETGGYLRVCTEGRHWFETDYPNWLQEAPPTFSPQTRSGEHGSWIIEGLETGRLYRGHFNVRNGHTITNLPEDAIVEVPGYVDRNGISVPRVGALPLGCAAVCRASVSVQELAVEAAVHADLDLLRQAFLMDPLTGAVCNTAEIEQLVDEMLVAQAPWLPQWVAQIERAKQRLAAARPLGTRKTQGAARIKTRSVDELRREREESARTAHTGGKTNVAGGA